MRLLTAELLGSPVHWFSTSMAALSGELGHSVAQAEGICVAISGAVAEVCNTGRGEGGDVEQTVAAAEGRPRKDLLAQGFLQDERKWENLKNSSIIYVKFVTEAIQLINVALAEPNVWPGGGWGLFNASADTQEKLQWTTRPPLNLLLCFRAFTQWLVGSLQQ